MKDSSLKKSRKAVSETQTEQSEIRRSSQFANRALLSPSTPLGADTPRFDKDRSNSHIHRARPRPADSYGGDPKKESLRDAVGRANQRRRPTKLAGWAIVLVGG